MWLFILFKGLFFVVVVCVYFVVMNFVICIVCSWFSLVVGGLDVYEMVLLVCVGVGRVFM